MPKNKLDKPVWHKGCCFWDSSMLCFAWDRAIIPSDARMQVPRRTMEDVFARECRTLWGMVGASPSKLIQEYSLMIICCNIFKIQVDTMDPSLLTPRRCIYCMRTPLCTRRVSIFILTSVCSEPFPLAPLQTQSVSRTQ